MAIYTSVLTGGTNSHETTSEEVNAFATDFANEGVTGTISNTGGVAPATGSFAVNAQGTPDMTVAVSSGVAYVTGTPTSQNSQTLRVRNTASANVTISANSSGSTKYDWIYISLSATNAANPAVAGDDVATLVASRSTSSTSDDGTPPTYGYPLAVVTVANGASSITNGNIQDIRNQVVLNQGLNTGTDGWTNAGETWTYASATTFTVSGVDVTAKYHRGTKIKLTQTSTKYFRVESSSFSTNTTVTVTGVGDYTLANAAIVNPYYSYAATPQGFPRKIDSDWWEELGRTTLSGVGDTISVASMPARKYLRIEVSAIPSGSIRSILRFNNDTGSNYNARRSDNNGADATSGAATSVNLNSGAASNFSFIIIEAINISTQEKLCFFRTVGQTAAGAANAPDRLDGSFKWANTSASVTRVDIINSSTGDYAANSEVVVYGHD